MMIARRGCGTPVRLGDSPVCTQPLGESGRRERLVYPLETSGSPNARIGHFIRDLIDGLVGATRNAQTIAMDSINRAPVVHRGATVERFMLLQNHH